MYYTRKFALKKLLPETVNMLTRLYRCCVHVGQLIETITVNLYSSAYIVTVCQRNVRFDFPAVSVVKGMYTGQSFEEKKEHFVSRYQNKNAKTRITKEKTDQQK